MPKLEDIMLSDRYTANKSFQVPNTLSASQTPTIFSLPPPVKVSMLMNQLRQIRQGETSLCQYGFGSVLDLWIWDTMESAHLP